MYALFSKPSLVITPQKTLNGITRWQALPEYTTPKKKKKEREKRVNVKSLTTDYNYQSECEKVNIIDPLIGI